MGVLHPPDLKVGATQLARSPKFSLKFIFCLTAPRGALCQAAGMGVRQAGVTSVIYI